MEITTLVLFLTDNCNLRCYYCFEKPKSTSMDLKTAIDSVDFLFSCIKESKDLTIVFFGGEPLLRYDLIKEVTTYAEAKAEEHKKNVSFRITTNGTLFTEEIVSFFYGHRIGITISWDGDRRQVEKAKGKAGYQMMKNSLGLLSKYGLQSIARLTIDPKYMEFASLLSETRDAGFFKMLACRMFLTEKWNKNDVDEAFRDFSKYIIDEARKGILINEFYLERNLLVMSGLINHYDGLGGPGVDFATVLTDGSIVPCEHYEYWVPEYVVGNVHDKIIDTEKLKVFSEIRKKDVPACKLCRAYDYCFEGSPLQNYEEAGDFLKIAEQGCYFPLARHDAVQTIYDALYREKKNVHFIRWLIMKSINWEQGMFERILKIPLESNLLFPKRIHEAFFDIPVEYLTETTGQKIFEFSTNEKKNNPSFFITKPLPPCVARARKAEDWRKLGMPNALMLHKLNPDTKNSALKTMFSYLEGNMDLPVSCRKCIFRMRRQCEYCYFGPK